MIVEDILERLSGRETMELLVDMLEEKSADFAEDRMRCADAVKNLQEVTLLPSVNDLMEAICEQTSAAFLFALCLGLKDNLRHFIDPVARTFLEADCETYLREGMIRQLPEYLETQRIRQRFAGALSVKQQPMYEDIAAFAVHLEGVIPSLAHYYGYLLGNELFSRIVPGYYPDTHLTMQYHRKIEDDLGMEIR